MRIRLLAGACLAAASLALCAAPFGALTFAADQGQKLSPPRDALDRPNVVVILLDDAGYGDFEHNGNPTIRTPRIAQLAHDGACFTQFYVASPACSASRYSLLTGRAPARSGLGYWVVSPQNSAHLLAREMTLADGLRQRGYATGMFGKWHLGTPNAANHFSPAAFPLAHGFDQWLGTNVSHDYADAMLLQSDPAGKEPIAGYRVLARKLPSDRAVCESLTGRYTRAAVDFIHANRSRPFFAYIALNQPHLGLFCGKEFQGTSRRGILGDVMAEVDHCVGAVLDSLSAEGVAGNTLVIFASDNGPWLKYQTVVGPGEERGYGDTRLKVGYAMPFRNGKGSDWEGGHRVPGLFYWPGVIPPARILEPASTLDVLPTIFRLAAVSLPADRTIDGRDIRALLSPQLGKGPVAPFVFLYPGPDNQPLAIRKGPWKLMIGITEQYRDDGGFTASAKKPLLFQLEQDISERIDRAAEHPDIVASMLKELQDRTKQIHDEGTLASAASASGGTHRTPAELAPSENEAHIDEPDAPQVSATGK